MKKKRKFRKTKKFKNYSNPWFSKIMGLAKPLWKHFSKQVKTEFIQRLHSMSTEEQELYYNRAALKKNDIGFLLDEMKEIEAELTEQQRVREIKTKFYRQARKETARVRADIPGALNQYFMRKLRDMDHLEIDRFYNHLYKKTNGFEDSTWLADYFHDLEIEFGKTKR